MVTPPPLHRIQWSKKGWCWLIWDSMQQSTKGVNRPSISKARIITYSIKHIWYCGHYVFYLLQSRYIVIPTSICFPWVIFRQMYVHVMNMGAGLTGLDMSKKCNMNDRISPLWYIFFTRFTPLVINIFMYHIFVKLWLGSICNMYFMASFRTSVICSFYKLMFLLKLLPISSLGILFIPFSTQYKTAT